MVKELIVLAAIFSLAQGCDDQAVGPMGDLKAGEATWADGPLAEDGERPDGDWPGDVVSADHSPMKDIELSRWDGDVAAFADREGTQRDVWQDGEAEDRPEQVLDQGNQVDGRADDRREQVMDRGNLADLAVPHQELCSDGQDNDGDGRVDCEDIDCWRQSCREGEYCTLDALCEPAVAECDTELPGYCLIPPGSFIMGAPEDELGWQPDEGPQHEVTITRWFYMKATEVTQGEWERLYPNNPSSFTGCEESCPVENVLWWEAVAYCNALSRREGLEMCYELGGCHGNPPGAGMFCTKAEFLGLDCQGYRLPTEAEWEYAARAGTTTAFYTGDITVKGCDIDPNLDRAGWYCGNSEETTHPVGQKEPNRWGLFGIHGNVQEWIWGGYGSYEESPMTDPLGPDEPVVLTGTLLRGGSWREFAHHTRSADRLIHNPDYTDDDYGFRVARTRSLDLP